MTKVTLSVSKVYKNTGSLRFHRKKTSKHWKHYFLDDKTGEWKFNTEWVNSINAKILKLKKYKIRQFICTECFYVYPALCKNSRSEVECPRCED